ncbi:hypothetical protein ACFXDE_18600 [Kitasatospora sp. NPDC059408]|uniref:hypothetical protein n=1 Tax=Kitasatospora sp. NPDC059408 TaxID=3346823 RepID=UPI0036B7A9D1
MPTDDMFEDGFARALRGAAELAPEPVQHTLAAVAEQRGRRWRRRRRAVAASALAVLVLAGVGGFAAVDRGASRGAVGPADPAPEQPMSAHELVALVGGLLPKGTVTPLGGGDPTTMLHGHQTAVTLLFDDGAGASIIEAFVDRTNLRPEAGAVCMDPFQTPQDSCRRTVRPDGAAIAIDKLRTTTTPGGREWRATLARPDGNRIQVIEYNGQPATANRPDPPLNDAQLTALVCSMEWFRVFAALSPVKDAPAPGAAPAPTPSASAPSNAELLAKVVPLLPAGAKVEGQDPEHGVLTVTVDGRTSMLMVGGDAPSRRGQDDLGSMDDNLPTPLEVREKQPDGTLVVTNRFGNGKTATNPILHWTAAVHTPDGGQVRISEWNGENAYTYRPGDPALDLDHLKAIVTAPTLRP